MIPEHSARFRLAHAIRTSAHSGETPTGQWADIIRYVTGSVVPVLHMGEDVAQKILDFIRDQRARADEAELKKPDKKRESESPLIACDFSEIERRVMAWDGWHEGPILGNGFPFKGTPTGRFSSSSDPRPQHLASRPAAGVASGAVVNPNEEP